MGDLSVLFPTIAHDSIMISTKPSVIKKALTCEMKTQTQKKREKFRGAASLLFPSLAPRGIGLVVSAGRGFCSESGDARRKYRAQHAPLLGRRRGFCSR